MLNTEYKFIERNADLPSWWDQYLFPHLCSDYQKRIWL